MPAPFARVSPVPGNFLYFAAGFPRPLKTVISSTRMSPGLGLALGLPMFYNRSILAGTDQWVNRQRQ